MTSKATTLQQGHPSNGFGKRVAMVILGTLAVAGVAGSPASALPLTGVGLVGGGGKVPLPDPCQPQPQIVSFTSTAVSGPIVLGSTATLSWSVQVPAGCNYVVSLLGQNVGPQGSVTVQPILDTTYELTLVWGASLTLWTKAYTGISVALPPDPGDPTRHLLTITNPPSRDLFLKGLMTSNTTVMVDNAVELDLSGFDGIAIKDGVRLIGGRTAVPGKPYQPGPRLFTTTTPSRLFNIQGPGVRITGLRIQGRLSIDPPGIASEDNSNGVSIWSTGAAEIDHNEIYGWSNAGVEVLGDDNAMASTVHPTFDGQSLSYPGTPEPAYIHDNYFHHNLHTHGYGYGVVIGNNGHALIERNVFDWNRHAIAGDGSNWSGYRAYRNLVLANGGYNYWNAALARWEYTHQFDMHGQDNCGAAAVAEDIYYGVTGFFGISDGHTSLFNCGTAGNDVDILYNSFLYTSAAAVKVRGTPQMAAVAGSNVFAHEFAVDTVIGNFFFPGAVEWTEAPVTVHDDNQVGVTTWETADTCDFDGDGIPDRFMTTGQTWWFSSNRGQGPWVYLNASTLHVRDVALGYFDGDNLCDVVAAGVTYSGGTTPLRPSLRTTPAKARLLLGQ